MGPGRSRALPTAVRRPERSRSGWRSPGPAGGRGATPRSPKAIRRRR